MNNAILLLPFFYHLGLELKKEKALSHLKKPLLGALGGVIAPVLLYCLFKRQIDVGAVIPTATDVALGIWIWNIFVPKGHEKWFSLLLSIALLDDVFALLISTGMAKGHFPWNLVATGLGLFTPNAILYRLLKPLEKISLYGLIPLYVFTQWPKTFAWDDMSWPLALALFLGKPLGISLGLRLSGERFCKEMWGMGQLGGMAFTMSFYLNDLTLQSPGGQWGILAATLASAIAGASFLRY